MTPGNTGAPDYHCEGKQRFETRGDAVLVLKRRAARRKARRRSGRVKYDLDPYQCYTCGHWHLGNKQ